MRDNVIIINLQPEENVIKLPPIYRADYGLEFRFTGEELPAGYKVYFSNEQTGGTATQGTRTPDGATVPDECIKAGGTIYAWVFIHPTPESGQVCKAIILPVVTMPGNCQ